MKSSRLLNNVDYTSCYDSKVHSHQLKICRLCLQEGLFHNIDWQLIESSVCHHHLSPLTTSCVHMYVDDGWGASMQCKACVPSLPGKVSIPRYEHYLYSLESIADRQKYISTLKAIAERMIRPFDFVSSSIRWAKLAPSEVRILLEDAFQLGEVPCTFELWHRLLMNHRKDLELLGQAALNIELISLENVLSQICWPRRDIRELNFDPAGLLIRYHLAPIPADVIAAQWRYQYCQEPEDFSFLVTGVIVAELLGVHPKAITELVSSGTVPAIHACQQPDKQLFDIRTIKLLLTNNSIEKSVAPNDYISIQDIPLAIYELYDLTPETLINKAMSANFDSQIRVNSTLQYVNKLQISTKSLKELLKQSWMSLRDCSKPKVAKILRTNTSIVDKLLEQKFLSLKSDDTKLIDASSIHQFVNDFLLINRKATFSQSRNIAQKISACCGAKPVFSMYMNPTKTDFVVFRKSELSTCCMQHIPKRFGHFSTPRVDLSKNVRSLFANISTNSNSTQ